jgi:hypothetical protein
MTTISENKHEGEKAENWAHGQGTFTFKNGAVYSGLFYKGNFHGEGRITYPNGGHVDGVWEQGLLVEKRYYFADGLEYADKEWDYCKDSDRRFYQERLTSVQPLDKTLLRDSENGLRTIRPGTYGRVNRYRKWRL